MKVFLLLPILFIFSSLYSQDTEVMESKGAIIIASLEGQVTVTNNETQAQLPASQIKAGGLLFDGHTIKTGPSSKIILLLSNGTVSTIKSDSALNIKKFTQEKFDPSQKKLSDMKGEPSSSQTVMDLELGDMVFDVKKLDKRSSFNIESPVGTAGIRGTSGQMGVMANNGATNLNINMFKGAVATQLRGSDIATMVRQGQSFSAGISASGIILPPTLGKVPPSLLASIEADLEASEGATGVSSVNDSSVPTSEGSEDVEDEAPSEEELQEQDAEQAAAAKGVDDNGSKEAVALDKAGLIDLNDPEKLEKVDTYVKVSRKGADKLEEKAVARRLGRRAEGEKTESEFIGDLVGNFDNVVDVTEQAAEIGVESAQMFESLLENSENSGAVKEVVAVAAEIGVKDKANMESMFTNVDQADDLKEVMDVAKKTLGSDDGTGGKKLDSSSASILSSTLQNADKADSMKEVMETSADLGLQDAASLTAVFSNADKADDLKAVMDVAKSTLGADDGSGKKKLDAGSASILASTLKNADKADSMKEVMETSADLGLQDAASLTNVFKNADKATDLKNVMDVAKKSLGTDDGSGNFKLDASSASILASTLQNADQADKLNEVMETSADLGLQDSASLTNVFKNADKATDLVAVMDVAKKSLGTDDGSGNFKLDASSASILASTLQNADQASAMKDVMETSADLGLQDAASLTNVFKNADKAADLVAVMDVAKKSLGSDDGSGNFKLDASSASILASTLQNADQAAAMKDVMETSAELGLQDAASLTAVFSNADKAADLKAVMDVAKETLGTDDGSGKKKLDASSASILASTLQNADQAAAMKEVMEASADLGLQDAASLTAVFSNADKATDLKAVMDSAKKSLGTDDGSGNFKLDSGSASSLASVLQNADKASDFRKVTDQLGSIGLEGGNADVFSNIEDVAAVFVEVGDSDTGSIDSDFAKNILGNAKEAGEVRKAIKLVQDNGGASNSADLLTLAKKDVSELKAINKVAEEFGGSGDALKAFVNDGLDQALQLEKAFEDGVDATTISASVGSGVKFTDVVGNSVIQILRGEYSKNTHPTDADILEVINLNTDKAQDINFARSFVQRGSAQESALFANLENIAPIMRLSNRFENEPSNLEIVYNNLDVAASLDKLVSEFSIYPNQLNIIMQNADIAPAILDYETSFGLTPTMLTSTKSLKDTLSDEGLTKLLNLYPDYADVIRLNADKAGEISGLLSLAGNKYANEILSNLDQFETIEVLVFRSKQDVKKLESLFSNLIDLPRIKEISDSLVKENIPGGQDALFTNLSTFSKDPGYFLLALEHPRFMVRLHEMTGDLSRVSSTLAYELVVLNLTRDELLKVLSDLIEGPLSTGPVDAPPSDATLSQEFAAVTILESHSFNGEIPNGVVLTESQVRASNMFQETLDVYDALSLLDNGQNTDSASSTSTGLIGGVSLTFNPGKYDLSSLGFGSYLVASTESISLSGELTFTSSTNVEELLFISAGGISVSEGTSIDFSGDSLGLGSFDSVNIVNVDLHAEDEIGVRSLDSIVINNSDFATRGTGADMIHLIAASELAIDNLRFSEQIRQITMEAMTINLSNLNFPAGSTVNLNSAYGGVDGVYPNFGSSAVGRVNFIQNVKYNSHLLNNKSAFDTYGTSITIGVNSN